MMGDIYDVIMCAEFQIEIFMGYDFTGGVEFSIFLLIFAWASQQSSANALPVITVVDRNYTVSQNSKPIDV